MPPERLLSDRMSLHFFELPKLTGALDQSDMLKLWLALFKAKTKKELKGIEALEVPVMSEAIEAYYNITAESMFRESERLHSKALHDEASALAYAVSKGEDKGRREGRREGERKKALDIAWGLLVEGDPIEKIARITGLTHDEIESLRKS